MRLDRQIEKAYFVEGRSLWSIASVYRVSTSYVLSVVSSLKIDGLSVEDIRRYHDRPVLTYMPQHPRATNGYVSEETLVVEKTLDRRLGLDERVGHKNGIKLDNRPQNLFVSK